MATDANSLLAQASCYSCYASNNFTLQLMQLALLRQTVLAVNPMADTSPQTLLAQAKCFECFAPNPYALKLMELALLAQLVSGGGTGVQEVFSGNGSPAGVITPVGTTAIYVQLDSVPPRTIWTFAGGTWS